MSDVGRVTDLSQEAPSEPARIDRITARFGTGQLEIVSQGGLGIREALVAVLYIAAVLAAFACPTFIAHKIGCGPTPALITGVTFAVIAVAIVWRMHRDGAGRPPSTR
jgi:hypothetical protein